MLILPNSARTVRGAQAILDVLELVQMKVNRVHDGVRFAALMACISALIFVFSILRVALLAVSPLFFAVGAMGTSNNCASCGFVHLLTANVLPLLLASCAFLALLSLSGVERFSIWFGTAFAILAIFMACGQPVLVMVEPKLCFFCLLGGTAALAVAASSAQEAGFGVLGGLRLSRCPMIGLLCGTVAVASVQALCLAKDPNYLDLAKPAAVALMGKNIDARLRKLPVGRSALLLVVLPGCPACKIAETELVRRRISHITVDACALLSSDRCFDASDFRLVTPLLIRVDDNHRVSNLVEGWPSDRLSIDRAMSELLQTSNYKPSKP